MSDRSRTVGLLLGLAADAAFGDPGRLHPVAGFGALATGLERRVYRDGRLAGVLHAAAAIGGVLAAAAIAERATRGHAAAQAVLTAAATWVVLGGRSLAVEASALAGEVERGDLSAARRRLPNLCGRDPAGLDAAGLLRAGVESVAENASDAVVAPLLWGAALGAPGLLGYRAVNTLDAMIGYRSARYRRFGWAAARLDDLANLVPARITAGLLALLAPAVGGSTAAARSVRRRDAGAHPSPNAGQVEAAMAGALGVRLGGALRYPHGVEHRAVLGDGPPPTPGDLRRAVRLGRLAATAAAVLATAAAVMIPAAGRCTPGPRRAGPRQPTSTQ